MSLIVDHEGNEVDEEVWTDLTGKAWKVADMSDAHVRNALRHVIKKSRELKILRLKLLMEEEAAENSPDYIGDPEWEKS